MSFHEGILRLARQREWPRPINLSEDAQATYLHGLDKVDQYRGHPAQLVEALDIFESADSLPYACAGVAYTLINASYIQATDYEQEGLAAARVWLEQAQGLAADRPEIDIVELFIDIHSNQYEQIGTKLDRLKTSAPNNYRVILAEFLYACKTNGPVNNLYVAASRLADTPAKKVTLLQPASRYFLSRKEFEFAEDAIRQILAVTPDDPWQWHNLSIACVGQNKVVDSIRSNKRALQLMEFGNAYKVQSVLKEAVPIRYALIRAAKTP